LEVGDTAGLETCATNRRVWFIGSSARMRPTGAAAGNCTTMRGVHEQSRQSTAMEPGRRRDPDDGVARI